MRGLLKNPPRIVNFCTFEITTHAWYLPRIPVNLIALTGIRGRIFIPFFILTAHASLTIYLTSFYHAFFKKM